MAGQINLPVGYGQSQPAGLEELVLLPRPVRGLALAGIHDHVRGGLDASEKPSGLNFRMQSGRVRGSGRTDTVTGSCAIPMAIEA